MTSLTPQERLSHCRTRLIMNHSFWGSLALSLKFQVTDSHKGHFIKTAAVTMDGDALFNPEFMASLTDKELEFLIAHELGHCMFDHIGRMQSRHGQLWNHAADYHLNNILVENHVGQMPESGLLNPQLVKDYPTTEALYTYLLSQQPQQPEGEGGSDDQQSGDDQQDSLGNGKPEGNGDQQDSKSGSGKPKPDNHSGLDEMLEGEGDQLSEDQRRQVRDQWRQRVVAAAQAAKLAGQGLGSMQGIVDQILKPKVNWADVLRDFMVKARLDERSFARPNRRYPRGINGLLLPTCSGEAMGELVIAVDCSGSITQQVLSVFAAEITAICNELLPSTTHVIYFASQVSHHDQYDRYEEPEITPHGGGGTAFRPVFEYIRDNDISPEVTVFLTDLWCWDFGPEPEEYPTIFVSTEKNYRKPNFGTVVVME